MTLEKKKIRPEVPAVDDGIGKKIKESLENALLFLGCFGVWPKKEPKIIHLDIDYPNDSDAIAVTNMTEKSERRFNEVVQKHYVKADYRYFGLTISDEAIAEYFASIFDGGGVAEESIPELGNGEDIALFRGIREELNALDATLAHEIWHLIEDRLGLAKNDPLILEGTATFVEKLYKGKEIRKPKIEDHVDVLYQLGAWIVANEIKKEKNPLKALLSLDVRRRIGRAFRREALGLFIEKVNKTYDPTTSKDFARREIRSLSSYRGFRKKPCRETYLEALRKEGYHKIAREIATQDTRRLIRYMASLVDKKGRK
jgi:hypothetical protein